MASGVILEVLELPASAGRGVWKSVNGILSVPP